MLKYLRIAVTALSLTACVLLIALWVRSYWWMDSLYINYYGGTDRITYTDVKSLRFFSVSGRIGISNRQMRWAPRILLTHSRQTRPYKEYKDESGQISTSAWFRLMRWKAMWVLHIPDWFLVLTFGVLAGLPWFPRSKRFSLRTLLIATTLVAVGLGLIIWAAK